MSDALTLDLSDLPKQQAAPLQLDLSDLPKASQPIAPYAGEDKGSQLSSYTPDSWLQDEIPAAPSQPLFTSVPRPPERIYRENAPQILQDVWDKAKGVQMPGPRREHELGPDLPEVPTLGAVGNWLATGNWQPESALPNEPTGIVENMEEGLRAASAHVASNVISLIGAPMEMEGQPSRSE